MSIGMMHEGYFVGRKELIGWVQQYFQPSFSKVEDCANGVVYCQIVDSIYPGAVPMSKVKMQAKTEVESIHNFKILQTAFSKKKIDRFIEVDKLTKRSFQTNMEFLQFMRAFWDMHAPNGAGGPENASTQHAVVDSSPNATPEKPPKAAAAQQQQAQQQQPKMAGGAKRAAPGVSRKLDAGAAAPAPTGGMGAAASSEPPRAAEKLEITELKMSVENLERERDFYYSKLREVEVLCQTHEGEQLPFLKEVLDILYKTDDADEFVAPEEGELAVQ